MYILSPIRYVSAFEYSSSGTSIMAGNGPARISWAFGIFYILRETSPMNEDEDSNENFQKRAEEAVFYY